MKKLFLTAIVCISLCLSACSSETENAQSDVLSASGNSVTVQSKADRESALHDSEKTVYSPDSPDFADFTETVMSDTDYESDGNYEPDVSNGSMRNFVAHLPETAELGVINVNNVDIDISGITLREFLDMSGLKHCIYANTDLQFADYEFVSGMYGIQSDESDPFSFDSLMSIEIMDIYGHIVDGDVDVMNDDCEYIVKGVCTSDFFMGNDFDVIFYGNIKCGMTIDDIYAALGGEAFAKEEDFYADDCIYLCTDKQVLVILPRSGVADKIMLLNW